MKGLHSKAELAMVHIRTCCLMKNMRPDEIAERINEARPAALCEGMAWDKAKEVFFAKHGLPLERLTIDNQIELF